MLLDHVTQQRVGQQIVWSGITIFRLADDQYQIVSPSRELVVKSLSPARVAQIVIDLARKHSPEIIAMHQRRLREQLTALDGQLQAAVREVKREKSGMLHQLDEHYRQKMAPIAQELSQIEADIA